MQHYSICHIRFLYYLCLRIDCRKEESDLLYFKERIKSNGKKRISATVVTSVFSLCWLISIFQEKKIQMSLQCPPPLLLLSVVVNWWESILLLSLFLIEILIKQIAFESIWRVNCLSHYRGIFYFFHILFPTLLIFLF